MHLLNCTQIKRHVSMDMEQFWNIMFAWADVPIDIQNEIPISHFVELLESLANDDDQQKVIGGDQFVHGCFPLQMAAAKDQQE